MERARKTGDSQHPVIHFDEIQVYPPATEHLIARKATIQSIHGLGPNFQEEILKMEPIPDGTLVAFNLTERNLNSGEIVHQATGGVASTFKVGVEQQPLLDRVIVGDNQLAVVTHLVGDFLIRREGDPLKTSLSRTQTSRRLHGEI